MRRPVVAEVIVEGAIADDIFYFELGDGFFGSCAGPKSMDGEGLSE